MIYRDFEIEVVSSGDAEHVVRLRTPFGRREAPFIWPINEESIPHVLSDLERFVVGEYVQSEHEEMRQAVGGRKRLAPLAERIGRNLFESIFSSSLRETWAFGHGGAGDSREQGIRIRMVFDMAKPEGMKLAALPWELLYDSSVRDFVGRSRMTPIVRFLSVPRLSVPPPLGKNLRVLVASASPGNGASVEWEAEQREISAAIGEQTAVQTTFLHKATWPTVYEALRARSFDAFHFIGHGRFSGDGAEGELAFDDGSGGVRLVAASTIAEGLRNIGSIRLVVLNACRSGSMPRWNGRDPYSSVGAALVLAGMPAVVATQFSISNEAASVFSRTFYGRVSAGDPVDESVAEGRFAMAQTMPNSWAWSTPVLYMSLPEGRLFDYPHQEIVPNKGSEPMQDDPSKRPPVCTNNHGVVHGPVGNVVDGDLHYTAAPNVADQMEDQRVLLLKLARRSLLRGAYEEATKAFETAIERGGDSAASRLGLAIGLLRARRPRVLSLREVRTIERHLHAAMRMTPNNGHVAMLLAFVKRDFYIDNGFDDEPPTFGQLIAKAAENEGDPEGVSILLEHTPIRDFMKTHDSLKDRVGEAR